MATNLFAASESGVQGGLAFAESLTEAYRPKAISESAGLTKHKAILSKLAAQPRPCAMIFVGASGTGKTSLAFAFGKTIRAEIHHIGSQEATIENVKQVVNTCHYVPLSGGFHLVVMDEADRMSPAVQLYLHSKLDGSEPVPNTIWIFTCNAVDTLQETFLSRCIRLPEFNTYGAGNEIKALLARIWKDRAGDVPLPDMSRVPTGNARAALQWCEVELLSL